jgi:hypothetical protein
MLSSSLLIRDSHCLLTFSLYLRDSASANLPNLPDSTYLRILVDMKPITMICSLAILEHGFMQQIKQYAAVPKLGALSRPEGRQRTRFIARSAHWPQNAFCAQSHACTPIPHCY